MITNVWFLAIGGSAIVVGIVSLLAGPFVLMHRYDRRRED